eukprot:GHVN01017557.1.p1 GENE.GHVN01017557.1~~GHVN01017557.1.p1  ORF type:complete len:412 (-),score=127.42 GHVN01017557.1:220-1398(-)
MGNETGARLSVGAVEMDMQSFFSYSRWAWPSVEKRGGGGAKRGDPPHSGERGEAGGPGETGESGDSGVWRRMEEEGEWRRVDEAPLFVFDPRFVDQMPKLADDYNADSLKHFAGRDYFSLIPNRPNYRWILLGGRGSGSKWHVDPNATHAWNAVVSGSKRWFFFSPDTPPPGVFPSADSSHVTQPLSLIEWLINFHKSSSSEYGKPTFSNGSPIFLEGTQNAGDVVFVPSGWWHGVLNLSPQTFAVTHNYVHDSNLLKVKRFLKFKVDSVTGVDEDRRALFYRELDDVLTSLNHPLTSLTSLNHPLTSLTSLNHSTDAQRHARHLPRSRQCYQDRYNSQPNSPSSTTSTTSISPTSPTSLISPTSASSSHSPSVWGRLREKANKGDGVLVIE